MLCSFNFFIAVLPDCVDFHIWSLWSTCLISKWISYHQTWSAKWSFWLSKLVQLQVRHNFECSCCVIGWVSGTKQPWRLICPSSWFVRGLALLPALMHCSITKIPSVSEGRGGEEERRRRARPHTSTHWVQNILATVAQNTSRDPEVKGQGVVLESLRTNKDLGKK